MTPAAAAGWNPRCVSVPYLPRSVPAGNDARLRHGPPSPLMPQNVHVLVTADRAWSEGGSQRDDGEDDDGGGEGEGVVRVRRRRN